MLLVEAVMNSAKDEGDKYVFQIPRCTSRRLDITEHLYGFYRLLQLLRHFKGAANGTSLAVLASLPLPLMLL